MKKAIFFTIVLQLSILFTNAQFNLQAYYESFTLDNPNTKNILNGYTFFKDYTATNTSITSHAISPLALSSFGYLYAVEDAGGIDNYKVAVYDTKIDNKKVITTPNLDWNSGAKDDARTRGMAATNSGQLLITAFSVVSGKNYLNYCLIAPNGFAPTEKSPSILTTTDLSSFEVLDIAVDIYSNLYALVNDLTNNKTYIYFVKHDFLKTAKRGETVTMEKKFQLFDENGQLSMGSIYSDWQSNSNNTNFSVSGGLAITNTGALAVSVDFINKKLVNGNYVPQFSNYIFEYQYTDESPQPKVVKHKLFEGAVNPDAFSVCSNLASNYFPVVLPTTIKDFKASSNNGQLTVNWKTDTENNLKNIDILVSKDGTNFTTLTSLNSSSNDGNSNNETIYSFSKQLNSSLFLLPLLLLPFAFLNKKRKSLLIILITATSIFMWGCSKNDSENNMYTGKVFVKLVINNKNGTSAESKIITAASL